MSFWFTLTPPAPPYVAVVAWTIVAAACIVLAAAIRAVARRRVVATHLRTLVVRATRAVAVNGVVLFVLLFFRYERIPFFGGRFWILVLVAADIAWLVVFLRHVFVRLPAQRRAWAAAQEKNKYLRK